jgi:hypothetical protein
MKQKEYKSRLICKDKVYYNIHHFNRFQKLLARIIWKIKIEDIEERNLEDEKRIIF